MIRYVSKLKEIRLLQASKSKLTMEETCIQYINIYGRFENKGKLMILTIVLEFMRIHLMEHTTKLMGGTWYAKLL